MSSTLPMHSSSPSPRHRVISSPCGRDLPDVSGKNGSRDRSGGCYTCALCINSCCEHNRSCEGACRSWIPPMDECDLYLTHVKAFDLFEMRSLERETRYGLYRYVILVLSSVHVSPPTTQLGVVGGSIRSRGAAGLASELPKSYFIICTNRFGRNV